MYPSGATNNLNRELERLIDSIIASESSAGTQIKIEATVIRTGAVADGVRSSSPERIVLETLDIDSLQSSLKEGCSSQRNASELSQHGEGYQLPSPATSHVHSPTAELTPRQGESVTTRQEEQEGARITRNNTHNASSAMSRRRKTVGALSIPKMAFLPSSLSDRSPSPPSTRQLQTNRDHFRKRRRLEQGPKLEQSTVDRLVEGIWKGIHNPNSLACDGEYPELLRALRGTESQNLDGRLELNNFDRATQTCRKITEGARTGRSLEVIMQAYWVDCFDGQLASLAESRPDLRPMEQKKATLTKACELFNWSEKELRNRIAIWKGYRDIKNAAGWSALIFAGPGIYRYCKYRLGLDPDALAKFRGLKTRFEVAADTLHPTWRQMLPIVGASTQLHWRGHPHDWVVSKRKDPLPLAFTYRQWDANFYFRHINECEIDVEQWSDEDPRLVFKGPEFICQLCSQRQSASSDQNECVCFAEVFGINAHKNPPVQLFQTENGRNNGVIACCTLPRDTAVGEYVGLITKGLANIDVMQSQVGEWEPYQIWQGRCGNFTRFINHSCEPNCQFQTFSWLGIQRILVISKGVSADKELTVDYSSRYWEQLDKRCLCGSTRCRYARRPLGTQQA